MKQNFHSEIEDWLSLPFPLWNPIISTKLIGALFPNDHLDSYSILQILTGDRSSLHLIPLVESKAFPALELPIEDIKDFYDRHGLIPKSSTQDIQKINSAFECIKLITEAYQDINCLVKTVQIIEADNPDSDTSYSHPGIPFSIFISVCETDSLIADLRVVESILHEAMHLKLTLIERLLPLIHTNSKATFFSPWRQTQRPVRGILHGLFVFRTILDFFTVIKHTHPNVDFIEKRIYKIKEDISAISHFSNCHDLTTNGKTLVKSLLTNVVD